MSPVIVSAIAGTLTVLGGLVAGRPGWKTVGYVSWVTALVAWIAYGLAIDNYWIAVPAALYTLPITYGLMVAVDEEGIL